MLPSGHRQFLLLLQKHRWGYILLRKEIVEWEKQKSLTTLSLSGFCISRVLTNLLYQSHSKALKL